MEPIRPKKWNKDIEVMEEEGEGEEEGEELEVEERGEE